MKKYVIAIDPGNTMSGVCIVRTDDFKPLWFDKLENKAVMTGIIEHMPEDSQGNVESCIEMVACYGMPVGREVFDTCVWIGRFFEKLRQAFGCTCKRIYREEEKTRLCHSSKANDATIKQALVDRFAYGQSNYGKGTKKEPGWFYGFKADVWSAYAVGVTYIDKGREKEAPAF